MRGWRGKAEPSDVVPHQATLHVHMVKSHYSVLWLSHVHLPILHARKTHGFMDSTLPSSHNMTKQFLYDAFF